MSNGKKKLLNFRVTHEEEEILDDYCGRTGRTRTDVVRELIRELSHRPTRPPRRVTTPRPSAKAKAKAAPVTLRRQMRRSA